MAAILDAGLILAILNFQCLPSSLSSIRLTVLEQMWFDVFQDGCYGGHLGYQNGTILAILNLHTAPMPSIKFPLYPTYGSGADNNWRLSRWLPWRQSWIWFWWKCRKYGKLLTDIQMRDGPWLTDQSISWQLKIFKMAAVAAIVDIITKCFRNSESPCCLNASHCCGHLGYRNGMNLAVMNLHVSPMSPTKFQLNPTCRLGAHVISRLSRCPPPLGYWNGMNLAILNR